MFCPSCGKQVDDDAKFCPNCGFSIAGGEPAGFGPTPPYGTAAAPSLVPMTLYQQKLAQAEREGLGMKWYKFVIYAQCFLGALSGLSSGMVTMFGLQYGDRAEYVYALYPSLKTADVANGIMSIAIAALLIYARFGLSKFKAKSINLYLCLPLVSAASSLIYNIVAANILGISPAEVLSDPSGAASSIIGSIGMFAANMIYFNHRRHLFTEA